MLKLTFG
jgi:hypothetical protein